jgi:hypothetical protein
VGTTGWTDRLDTSERDRFVTELVEAYQPIAGRAGLFRFMQMRAELSRSVPGRTAGPSLRSPSIFPPSLRSP